MLLEKEIKLILDVNNFTFRPDPKWVKEKKWFCRVYLLGYDRIEANFIANAVSSIDTKAIEFISHHTIKIISTQKITVDYIDNFYNLDRNIDIAMNGAGFTNKNCDYLYLKDDENEIFMLFGSKDFIEKAMPVSQNEYKLYYEGFYGEWVSKNIDDLLKRIWNDYCPKGQVSKLKT